MNYSYSLYYVEWNYFEYVTAYVCIHMHVEVVGQSQWYSLTCLELAKQARLAGHCVPGTCGPSPGIPVHNTTRSLVTAHSTACSLVWHYLTKQLLFPGLFFFLFCIHYQLSRISYCDVLHSDFGEMDLCRERTLYDCTSFKYVTMGFAPRRNALMN